jgi:hypothetical protein
VCALQKHTLWCSLTNAATLLCDVTSVRACGDAGPEGTPSVAASRTVVFYKTQAFLQQVCSVVSSQSIAVLYTLVIVATALSTKQYTSISCMAVCTRMLA